MKIFKLIKLMMNDNFNNKSQYQCTSSQEILEKLKTPHLIVNDS